MKLYQPYTMLAIFWAVTATGWCQTQLSLDNPAINAVDQTIYSEYSTGTTWKKLANAHPGDTSIILRKTVIPELGGGTYDPDKINSTTSSIENDISQSDVVVVVNFSSSKAYLTKNQDFVYSDFLGVVEQVILDRANALKQGSRIIVTRPGGTIRENQYFVTGIDRYFPPFRLDQRYVLFMKRVKGAPAYRATSNGTYVITDKGVVILSRNPSYSHLLQNENAFLNILEVSAKKVESKLGGYE